MPIREFGAMGRLLLLLSIALGLVAGGLYFRGPIDVFLSKAVAERQAPRVTEGKPLGNISSPDSAGTGQEPPPNKDAVPVVVATAELSNVPIYLSGIGTVIASNTVDIKAHVDGIILSMNFREGDDVRAGDPLVTIDPTPYQAQVERWQAAKQKAEALLANAKSNLARAEKLRANNYATEKQIDEQAALVNQYSAEVAEAEAQIKFNQYQLDNTIIRSPIDGRTGIRQVDPGNLIRAEEDTIIVTVVQLQPISVVISVPAKDLAQVGISQGLTDLPVFAYAQDGQRLLDRGKVRVVNNVVDPATGTIQLKASFANKRYRLWPGEFTDCRVIVDWRKDGVTIPTAAVQHGPKGDFVWVIRPDGTAEAISVVLKQTVGDVALLDKGLSGGERVVVEGQYNLEAGSRVEIVPEKDENDSMVSNEAADLPN
jgi:multidrug efflux system membrane fusion protein